RIILRRAARGSRPPPPSDRSRRRHHRNHRVIAHTSLEVRLPARDAPMLSRRSAEIAAMLGVTRTDLAGVVARPRRSVRIPIAPGSIVLITGPSGSGKSTLLRAIVDAARGEDLCIVEPPTRLPAHRPCC